LPINREMDRRAALAATALVACLAAVLAVVHHRASAAPIPRAAGPAYAGVAPRDEAWIRTSIAEARPEAAQLIDDVDGTVTFRTVYEPSASWAGLTQSTGPHRYTVTLNLSFLDGSRGPTVRDDVVLHELGHVVDFEVVPDGLRNRLAAEVPVTGTCFTADTGDCTAPQERFADTFAKWALRGAVSVAGAGYSIPMPASLEDWGAPLATLAAQLQADTGPRA
jgi:hypothetical protein